MAMHMGQATATVDWPRDVLAHEGPPRGTPVVDGPRCDGCGACVGACPSGSLSLDEGADAPLVDAGTCVRCGTCASVCPGEAIALTGARALAAYEREDLVLDGSPPGEAGVGPPPRRLYRMATGMEDQGVVEPSTILERRMRGLLRG
jgi:formate hydrogenlyase subunit 6/NADH:ubiquinone oxidoreductase subunit I